MKLDKRLLFMSASLATFGLGLVPVANASTTIPLSIDYSQLGLPDFYIRSTTFTLPAGFSNAVLNISTLQIDDRGVVQLNGTTVTSSGYRPPNVVGLSGQMVLKSGDPPQAFTFEHEYFDTVFARITTGFQTGLNTLDIIVNDTSGGLNFRQGLLSGGYFWYTGRCFDNSGCPVTDVRGNITYLRGNTDAPTSVKFVGSVTYDLNVTQVPIPAALPLFATGVAAVAYAGRRKKKAGQAAA